MVGRVQGCVIWTEGFIIGFRVGMTRCGDVEAGVGMLAVRF